MKLERFVTNFSTSGNNKEKYVKDHIRSDYVSYADKVSDCERIVKACHYCEVDGKKRFRLNSPASAMMFALVLIGRYTNIDLEYTVNEYDDLERCGALSMIMDALPRSEYDIYSAVMQMVVDDTVSLETDLAMRVDDLKQAFSALLTSYVDPTISGADQ